MIAIRRIAAPTVVLLLAAVSAMAQNCTRTGTEVTCDDGRSGKYVGDAILWPDGTQSSASPHANVIIGHPSSVQVGAGVFVGKGNSVVPLDNPNGRFKQQCALLEGISYCY
jgi:hypothetical protein